MPAYLLAKYILWGLYKYHLLQVFLYHHKGIWDNFDSSGLN